MKKIIFSIVFALSAVLAFSQTDCTFTGDGAGNSNTTGDYNTFTGTRSGYYNTSGSRNTFTGRRSGYNNTSGGRNTFVGMSCGYNNTTASYNTFIGGYSGFYTTVGEKNVFSGYYSGYYNTTGIENAFIGYYSGYNSTSTNYSCFLGSYAGYSNTESTNNTYLGAYSGYMNTEGDHNVCVGTMAGYENTGHYNTYVGEIAGYDATSGWENTFLGWQSGYKHTSGGNNVFIGARSGNENKTGNYNVAIGWWAGPTGNNYENTISIGRSAEATASNRVRIGNDYITRIGGVVSWSTLSDGRFKKEMKENVPGLDFITKLRPVSYELDMAKLNTFKSNGKSDNFSENKAADQPSIAKKYTGFVAQEVENIIKENDYVFNGVQAPENENDQYAIRYADFVVPLVKAVQELNLIVEEQQEEINQLKAQVAQSGIKVQSFSSNGIELMQNTPNPFNTDTEIQMFLPEEISNAEIKVLSLDGKTLQSLPVLSRGNTSVTINGGTLYEGVYLYTLIVDGNIITSKNMVLTK